ncbi:glycosyltransferase [Kitasatospora sp. Root187]|uniref:glycosyltransferase n=1 Tax=Kitasatospora sp. Root187 TaxID=1736486 RepID=UPI001F1D8CA3|nr:nucleotide disphospho-sugar-binding domain-containing protein [Kitasatospora sp. Root187]
MRSASDAGDPEQVETSLMVRHTPLTSRFMLVVPPLTGHVFPTIGLGRELLDRGHQVVWTGSEPVLRSLLDPGSGILGTGSRLFRPQGGSGLAAVHSLWDGFVVPYARFTAKALGSAVRSWRPDVLVVDQHTPAGALTAHRHGLPWASLAPGLMELGRPFAELEPWIEERLRGLWQRAGLPAGAYLDPRFSPDLVLALTSDVLAGGPHPEQYALVGPVLADRPAQPDFPWERLDPTHRQVLVSMGTLAEEVTADFLRRTAAALHRLGPDVQAVVVAPRELWPAFPAQAVTVERAPVLELLARGTLSAVLGHGGLGTTGEALTYGVPPVLAPIRHDQPLVAARVAAAGAGLRISFEQAGPEEIAQALRRVLDGPALRAGAERLGAELRAKGGARTAVDRLELLAATAARRENPMVQTIVPDPAQTLG